MGNMYLLLVFFGICGFCVLIVIYSLVGRVQSRWMGLLSGLVLCLMVYVITADISRGHFRFSREDMFCLLLAGGSLAGTLRQFRKKSP